MKLDLIIRFTLAIAGSAIIALLFQVFVLNDNSGEFDEFDTAGYSGISDGQSSCGAASSSGNRVSTRHLFDETVKLAQSINAKDMGSSRRDLVQWRTKRTSGLRKRPGVTDNAIFDAYRPAYDAMCQSTEEHSECYRPLSEKMAPSLFEDHHQDGNNGAEKSSSSTIPKWATAVRKQIRLWSPSTSAFMQRPTLMCVSLVTDEHRLENALTQWKLWGYNCDDFFIALQLDTADATVVHNGTSDRIKTRHKFASLLQRYNFPSNHLWTARPLVSWKIQDPVRYDRWQAFRELSRVMGDEDLNHPVYNAEYTLFVRDDTYVIPENVFGFLSSAEVRHLEHISAPVMMGHVLQVPPPIAGSSHGDEHNPEEEAQVHDHQHDHAGGNDHHNHGLDKTHQGASDLDPISKRRLFASFDGGLIWNRVTRKLFMNAIRAQDVCAFANTEADDVMLADCFRYYGISPIDTADHRGSDRQHILRPEWAMTIGRDPKVIEWYSLFRGRPSLEGAAAISPTSMTFGGLESVEDLQNMHHYLSESS